MSYDEFDALQEEGLEDLYEGFKKDFEDNFIFDRIDLFYKENPEIVKEPLKNLIESRVLLKNNFITAAFLHSIISIEVGIKEVAIKPILYSLTINNTAGDLLYKSTFKQRSLQEIPKFYYQILKDITELDFGTIHRENNELSVFKEWIVLQNLRNEVVHQGLFVEREDAEKSIDVASYVCEEIIPSILDKFMCHIEEYVIQNGSREHMKRILKIRKKH